MNPKILCVDDEPNVLRAYERHLRKQFQVETAVGGEQGLAVLTQRGPFMVVVSDMRMPRMDGVEFLSKVRASSPDTVQVILSGQADLKMTIAAVNEGNIFRFLTKPCSPDVLAKTIEAALQQYRLITAERDLLEKTLSGSIKMLTEILGLVNPKAFSRAHRIRHYVRHMALRLQLPNIWEFELAATLSQIGCVAVPPNILGKFYAGQSLSADEQEILSAHPTIGANLLAKIPRLEAIAQMIEAQQKPLPRRVPLNPKPPDLILLGAQMLKVAIEFEQRLARGLARALALTDMRNRPQEYNPDLLLMLENIETDELGKESKMIRLHELTPGMIANEDVLAKSGLLLLAKGQEVTEAVIRRLHSFARIVGVIEPFSVQGPRPVDA